MLNADRGPEFSVCPRCENEAYEQLETYGHCVECLYSPDLSETVPSRFIRAPDEKREPLEVLFCFFPEWRSCNG